MIDFVLAPSNFPFAVAMALMVAIGLLEVVTLAFGFAASGMVDSLLPDFDVDFDVDVDVDVDTPDLAANTPALSAIFSWLHVGKVPTLILFVAFLLGFGLSGFAVQALVNALSGGFLPGWLAGLPAFFGSLPVIHVAGRIFRNVLPSEQTDAVARSALIGSTAVITLGIATKGSPAQARLKDAKRQTHYVMVEPKEDTELVEGDEVVLIAMTSSVFTVVKSDLPRLPTRNF